MGLLGAARLSNPNFKKKMLGRNKLTLEEFCALIAETKTVLNDRPLEEPS